MDEFNFGDWLRSELKHQHRSKIWLSEQTGLAPTTISRYTKNKRSPLIETANTILSALGKRFTITDKENDECIR